MKNLASFALSALVTAALVVGAVGSPAVAAGTSAAEEATLSTVDITGQITRVGDQVGESDVKLFHVLGYGYFRVDLSAITLGRTALGTLTLRLQVPAGVDVGADLDSQFAALSAYSTSTGAVKALSIAPTPTTDRTAARVNQTPATTAIHRIFAVVVTPFDVPSNAVTESQSVENIQADVDNANTYWRLQTENKVGFQLDGVSSWYKSDFSCDVDADPLGTNFDNLTDEATQVAYDELGYRDAFNNHLVLIFPSGSDCGAAIGLGTIGYSANSGGMLWAIGTQSLTEKQTLAHELGHNLSLGHANWLDCSTASPDPLFDASGCDEYAYGAAGDVMGYGDPASSGGSLSSAQAIRANLWPSTAYANAPQGTTVHVLNALSSGTGKRAVVVEDYEGTNFFVEFRSNTGIDAPFATTGCPAPVSGVGYCTPPAPSVVIQRLGLQDIRLVGWWYKGLDGDDSQLIGRNDGTRKVGYTAGQSFSLNGVVVTVTSITDTQATVSVTRPATIAVGGFVDVFCDLCTPGDDYYVGDTLTAVLDYNWVADNYLFQWSRSGVAIAGATAQSYTLTPADFGKMMSVKVTSVTAGSPNYTDSFPFPGAPPELYLGPIAYGHLVEGTVAINSSALPFTATLKSWFTDGTLFSYQWKRNGVNIVGATLGSYTPVAADNGTALSLTVTAKKAGYLNVTTTSAAKNYTLIPSGTLAITGIPQVGQELGVNPLSYSTVDGPATVSRTYQWYRSGVVIPGATSDDYTLVPADLSKLITAKVTATSSGYASNSTTTAATTAVVRGDIAGTYEAPVVTQTPATLQLHVALPDGSISELGTTPAFQWYRDDVVIPGAVAANYTLTAADYGKAVKARIVVTKLNYNSVALTSAAAQYSVTSTGSAAITGTVRVGAVLTAPDLDYSTWEGAASTTRTFQWYANAVAIPSATGGTYTPVAGDFGKVLTVRVTASLSEFLPSVVLSPATVPVAKGVLAGTQAAPSVDKSGTLLLTAVTDPASFTDVPAPSFAYQWFRNGVAIVGATLPTFQLTAADYNKTIYVRQTASKLNYTSVVGLSDPVNYSLVPDVAVPVFQGDVYQDGVLTLDTRVFKAEGSEVTPDSVTYQWLRDGVNIPTLSTSSAYALTPADVGKTISARVTATYAGYLQSVSTSAGTQKVGVALLAGASSPVTVQQLNLVLTAHPGVTDGLATHTKQWLRNGVAISLATGNTYTLTGADFGKTISVRVTSTRAGYTTVVGVSQGVDYSVTPSGPLGLSGTAQVGQTLTPVLPSYSSYEGPVSPTFAYQWLRNGGAIPGATGPTYTLVGADLGSKTSVRVSASLTGGLTSTLTSPMTVAVIKGTFGGDSALPTVTLNSGTMKLTASLTAGSVNNPTPTVAYQWFRNGVAVLYSTASTYQLTAADYNKTVSVRLIASASGYTSVTLTSTPVNYSLLVTAPAVISGTPKLGSTLTAIDPGYAAAGDPVLATSTYQWLRDGVAIPGATGGTYTPTAPADLGKSISLRVSGAYAGFLPSVSTSAATQKLAANAFDNYDALPTVGKSGLVLTVTPGALSPTPTFARQWLRNGVAIYLATGNTYTLTAADYGKLISVRVTSTKAGYTPAVATSVSANYSVTPSGALTVTGTARVGMVLSPTALSYSTSEGAISPTLSYQWLRNGISIAGATGPTYTAVAADYNTKLQVRVTAAQAGFLSNTTTSAATAVVAKGVFTGTMAAPTVTTNPVTFKLSVALTPGSIDQSALVLSYQWYRNGVAIYLATGSSYQLTGADVGKDIKVRVTVAKTNYVSVVQYSAVLVP